MDRTASMLCICEPDHAPYDLISSLSVDVSYQQQDEHVAAVSFWQAAKCTVASCLHTARCPFNRVHWMHGDPPMAGIHSE